MIGFLKGKVLAVFKTGKSVSTVIVWPYAENASGIGISVVVTDLLAIQFPLNTDVSLWTYHVVSENASYLIGLQTKEAMESFFSLLDVSGVGPKTALHIVDTLGVAALVEAIKMQDITAISKVPGVGKKTAAKILLELAQSPSVASLISGSSDLSSGYATVVATLQKLGYSVVKAKEAIAAAKSELDAHPDWSVSEQVTLILSKGAV